jgi:hypothetical protein
MPPIFRRNNFSFEAEEVPMVHYEGYPSRGDLDHNKFHIEAFDLESAETRMLAVNIDTPQDAAILLKAAIEHAKNPSCMEDNMRDMQGFAIVGPGMEGEGESRLTSGVAMHLRLGDELPRKMTEVLTKFAWVDL